MGLQRWPGSGSAQIGYGVPGNVTIDKSLNIITARQHRIGGFVNGGTTKIVDEVRPPAEFGDHSNKRADTFNAFMNSMDLGGIDSGLVRTNAYESHVLTSPSIIDPVMSRRVARISEDSANIAYGDDMFVNYFDTENNEVLMRLNMRSPVMQVDRNNVVRTCKGLAKTSETGEAEYFAEGDFVHVSSMPSSIGSDAVATSKFGNVMLFDTSTGDCKWKERRPRGSLEGWSRVASGFNGRPDLALWCNRYSLVSIDFREPPSSSTSTSHTLINFDDRQQEIRDLDGGIDGVDAFALTSYDIRWVACLEPSTLVSVNHPLATSDYSISMYKGKHNKNSLVTLSSQLKPMTIASVFGRTKSMPTLLDDGYFIDTWPSIIPQSHITVENAAGTALFSVGAEGGLYKQQWNETGLGETLDDIIDLPKPDDPVDNSRNTTEALRFHENQRQNLHDAFDLLSNEPPSFIYNFEKVYDMAFAPLGAEHNERRIDETESPMYHVDALDSNEFHSACRRAWTEPIQRKAAENPESVHSEVLVQRERSINKIVDDMIEVRLAHENQVNAWTGNSVPLDPEVQNILDLWDDSPQDGMEEAPSSQGFLSQPTQLPTYGTANDLMSSQADPMDIPLSQPMPTLAGSKRKHHKHKKKKKKHSSQ